MSLDLAALRRRLQEALGDEFRVGRLLGEGGFAAVFRVRDDALHRDVAVKVLDLGLTPSPALAERFVREARTVARLEHPHIVPIYKVGGYKNEVLYIIMRCIDGPSLRRLLETHHRLSVRNSARIARQVADALAYAHRAGVVHRDIKPDNILVDAAGHVLVTDFGIAKATEVAAGSPLTTEGMVIGTPQYMSPEQATGERTDSRSDLYSLGIVLYHMLAGEPPFDGESAQSILMKQATVTPTPIQRIRRDVPAALATLLELLLAKDPDARLSTAEQLSRALLDAVPAAARDRVETRRGLGAAAIASLRRVRVAGCLVSGAVLASGAAAGWAVFSRPPRVRIAAPVPDTLNRALRHRGILGGADTAVFAFAPGGDPQSPLFVVGRRRVVVAAPGHLRGYPRDSVAYAVAVAWSRGPAFLFILVPAPERRDTVYRNLSPRGVWELARGLRGLLRADPRAGGLRLLVGRAR